MKLFVLAAALLAASVRAAPCTMADVTAVKSSPEYEASMAAGCGISLMAEVTSCEANPCRKPLQAVLKIMPDCTVDGVAFKQEVQSSLDEIDKNCKSDGSSKPTTAPSATTSAPSAGSSSVWSDQVCSSEQVQMYKDSKFESVVIPTCGPLKTMVSPSGLAQTCSAPCRSAWGESLKFQQDCTIGGYNMKKMLTEAYSLIQERCPTVSDTSSKAASSPAADTTNSTSSPAANSSSNATSAPPKPASGSSTIGLTATLIMTVVVGAIAVQQSLT